MWYQQNILRMHTRTELTILAIPRPTKHVMRGWCCVIFCKSSETPVICSAFESSLSCIIFNYTQVLEQSKKKTIQQTLTVARLTRFVCDELWVWVSQLILHVNLTKPIENSWGRVESFWGRRSLEVKPNVLLWATVEKVEFNIIPDWWRQLQKWFVGLE